MGTPVRSPSARRKPATTIFPRKPADPGGFWEPLMRATTKVGGKPVAFTKVSISQLSPVARHDLVESGVPSQALRFTLLQYKNISAKDLLDSIGVSEKTLGRRKGSRLNEHHSDAAIALMEVTELAEDVLGSRELAEGWLKKPALGLDGKRPLDLLTTAPGISAVKDLLARIDYGVYA